MTAPLPILYSFRRCPYAMRARMALSVSGKTCALREVVLRDKPAEMLSASPKGTVPVLVLPDGQVVDESYDIMKWALGQNDPEAWLAPPHGTLAEIDALVDATEADFKHHLDRYKYDTRYEGVEASVHRAEGLRFLHLLEERLAANAYLFGDRLTLADVAIAPFVRQFANTDKTWFAEQDLPQLQAWLKRFLGSSLFQSVMRKYPQWRTGDVEPAFPG